MDEQRIIDGCLRKDRKCQKELYDMYAPLMYRICLAYTSDKALAQDILQDGFIKVFRSIDNYKQSGSLEGWIRRIISNTAIDHMRAQARERILLEAISEVDEISTDESVTAKLHLENIMDKINKLPEGAKKIFNLFVLEGYSHIEIAQKLNISVGTSKSQLNRAKHILQFLTKEMY
jgi:RNA polymerase sigma-70 factor (ECF subfamily)